MSARRYTVAITASAENDLREIANYYAEQDSVDVAISLIETIRAKVATLEEYPERGVIPEEVRNLGLEMRQLLVSPFRIFYLVEDRTVSVFMVADGRRDIESLLRQRVIGS